MSSFLHPDFFARHDGLYPDAEPDRCDCGACRQCHADAVADDAAAAGLVPAAWELDLLDGTLDIPADEREADAARDEATIAHDLAEIESQRWTIVVPLSPLGVLLAASIALETDR